MKTCLVAAAVMATVLCSYAQGDGFRLVGVKTIGLLIENLSPAADKCGITEALLRQAFMYPASSARFRIVSDQSDAIFYLVVATVHSPQVCASLIRVEVHTIRELKLFSNAPQLAYVQLWNNSWVGFSNPQQHGAQIKQKVEDITKQFVTEWNLQNK